MTTRTATTTEPTPAAPTRIPETLEHLQVDITTLRPYGRNPRNGDVDVIAESLAVNGQYRPIVVRSETSEILAGNHTYAAALSLGWTSIAATFVDCTDEQAAKIVLVDNRASDRAVNDNALLADLLKDLPDLSGTGYDQSDLDDLLRDLTPLPDVTDPDEAPDPPVDPVSVLGDVWLLGPHRLVCGDSTDVGVHDVLMAGGKADCVWTDPPYGVEYVGKTKEALTIDNDGRDLGDLEELLRAALGATGTSCSPGAAVYVAAPAGPATHPFGTVLTELGWWRQTLVWVKDAFVLGHSDYHYRHEIIYSGYTPGASGRRGRGGAGWYGDNASDTVLEVPRPRVNKEHPTMKPIDLISGCLKNSTRRGNTVLDPFGGSGSTLIAAHAQGRIARLIELDPRYVDVICRRFQTATGITPILEATGHEHDFTQET